MYGLERRTRAYSVTVCDLFLLYRADVYLLLEYRAATCG